MQPELVALQVNAAQRDAAAHDLPRLIRAAKATGASWPAIAKAANMSEQGVIKASKRKS